MGYAGRMLAKHDPWLNFGLWVVLVGLLNFSVICGLLQGYYSLWIGIIVSIACVISSLLVLASFFVGAKQQSYRNRHNAELELNRMEEWLLNAGALIVTVLIGIALLFAVGMAIWWIASLFI